MSGPAPVTLGELRAIDLFDDLDDERLEQWLSITRPRVAVPGEIVAEHGEPAPGVLLLLEGQMLTFLISGDHVEPAGRQVAPTWVGAISALTEGTLGVRMQAETTCRLGVIEPEVLVVELAQQRAAEGPHAKAHGTQEPEDEAGPRALAAARGADLVGLEVAALVEDEDRDRVVDDDGAVLERLDGPVGGGLGLEDGYDQPLVGHGGSPFIAPRAAPRRKRDHRPRVPSAHHPLWVSRATSRCSSAGRRA